MGELFKAMAKFREEYDLDPTFPLEISEIRTKGLGIYLGDIPIGATAMLEKATQALMITPHSNPAIYIPDLKRVVFGCESWWGTIEGPEDLKKITDQDIQDLWYVKALKEMQEEDGQAE